MKYTPFIFCSMLMSCQQLQEPSPFEAGISKGLIKDAKIKEASGLVTSAANPGMFWTHNDSGNSADIFLMDSTGSIKCTVHLSGIKNRDWEDIAIGSGPVAGQSYLYIAEIGDNRAIYEEKILYRIEEPRIAEGVTDTTLAQAKKIEFELSDGPRDTEALMIDPLSHKFYIISKRESRVNLYAFSDTTSGKRITAKRVLEKLPFTLIVAADISVDGTEILIKNYDMVFYWKRLPGESIEETIKREPIALPYSPEPQGESIAFARSGVGYYTISERKGKASQHLFFYKRK